jgi:hypothetical protein
MISMSYSEDPESPAYMKKRDSRSVSSKDKRNSLYLSPPSSAPNSPAGMPGPSPLFFPSLSTTPNTSQKGNHQDRPLPPPPTTVLEELDRQFGPAKTKNDVMKSLDSCQLLHCIPLPEPNVTLEQALKDFYREKVLFNDVAFIPDSFDEHRSHGFFQTMRKLLERLASNQSGKISFSFPPFLNLLVFFFSSFFFLVSVSFLSLQSIIQNFLMQ